MLTLFAILIVVQAAVIVAHDMVDIPGIAHGRQVRLAVGTGKFWIGTLINAVFPGIAAWYAIRFWRGPAPDYAANYWAAYCAVTVVFAITMWWLPYFFGAKDNTKRLYATMYAGTRHWLPARGDNPRPNVLHLFFHALFVLNLALACWIRFGAHR
jgi:hypothetical protein